MKKLFLSLAVLFVSGVQLFAECPYRAAAQGFRRAERVGRPMRRMEARDISADEDADADVADVDEGAPPVRAARANEFKDVELDANVDADQPASDNEDMDLGDLDR